MPRCIPANRVLTHRDVSGQSHRSIRPPAATPLIDPLAGPHGVRPDDGVRAFHYPPLDRYSAGHKPGFNFVEVFYRGHQAGIMKPSGSTRHSPSGALVLAAASIADAIGVSLSSGGYKKPALVGLVDQPEASVVSALRNIAAAELQLTVPAALLADRWSARHWGLRLETAFGLSGANGFTALRRTELPGRRISRGNPCASTFCLIIVILSVWRCRDQPAGASRG